MPLETMREEADGSRANPAKVEDFGDKDLLKVELARILIGEMIPRWRYTRLKRHSIRWL
jgi:hypothetical protein